MNANVISIIMFLVSTISSLIVVWLLPAGTELPIHWNAQGQPDNWASALEALMLPPLIMLFTIGIRFLLKFIEPRQTNLQQSQAAINVIILSIVTIFFVLEVGYLLLAFEYDISITQLLIFAISLSFALMGNFFGKIRSNYFVGIRTAWTLSSDRVWQKTHRLAGKLCVISGLICSVAIWFVEPRQSTYLVLFILVPSLLLPALYSWWYWRQEQVAQHNDMIK